jgi:hypothetical protein
MNKATRNARTLARRLTTLEPRDLAHVTGGGQTASTSTSGSPEAGDDTVGDTIGRGLPEVLITSYSISANSQ